MKDFYFTFGYNHLDRFNRSLGHFYAVIAAEDAEKARQMMFELRGNLWAFMYGTPEEAGVEKWNLKQAGLRDIALGGKA